MKIGMVGLIESKKATLSLIILACATTACLMGHLDGPSFSAVVATIGSIYMWTTHKTEIAQMGMK